MPCCSPGVVVLRRGRHEGPALALPWSAVGTRSWAGLLLAESRRGSAALCSAEAGLAAANGLPATAGLHAKGLPLGAVRGGSSVRPSSCRRGHSATCEAACQRVSWADAAPQALHCACPTGRPRQPSLYPHLGGGGPAVVGAQGEVAGLPSQARCRGGGRGGGGARLGRRGRQSPGPAVERQEGGRGFQGEGLALAGRARGGVLHPHNLACRQEEGQLRRTGEGRIWYLETEDSPSMEHVGREMKREAVGCGRGLSNEGMGTTKGSARTTCGQRGGLEVPYRYT